MHKQCACSSVQSRHSLFHRRDATHPEHTADSVTLAAHSLTTQVIGVPSVRGLGGRPCVIHGSRLRPCSRTFSGPDFMTCRQRARSQEYYGKHGDRDLVTPQPPFHQPVRAAAPNSVPPSAGRPLDCSVLVIRRAAGRLSSLASVPHIQQDPTHPLSSSTIVGRIESTGCGSATWGPPFSCGG